MTPEEAFDWLCKLAHRPVETLAETERVAGKTLVEKLGYLPLAIAQAAAYLEANPAISIATYLEQFAALLGDKTHANAVSQTGREEEQSRLVVSSTWEISVRAIKKKIAHPEVIDCLLNICAYLAAKDIPLCILEVWLKQHWPAQLKEPVLLSYWLDEYVGQLVHYSLIDRDSQITALSLHNLVQEMRRSHLTSEQQHAQIKDVLECLTIANYQEGKPEAEELWRSFLPHLEAVVGHQDQTERMEDVRLSVALGQLGHIYLGVLGQPNQSRDSLERALKIEETHYGPDHHEAATTLMNLGTTYGALGNPS